MLLLECNFKMKVRGKKGENMYLCFCFLSVAQNVAGFLGLLLSEEGCATPTDSRPLQEISRVVCPNTRMEQVTGTCSILGVTQCLKTLSKGVLV